MQEQETPPQHKSGGCSRTLAYHVMVRANPFLLLAELATGFLGAPVPTKPQSNEELAT